MLKDVRELDKEFIQRKEFDRFVQEFEGPLGYVDQADIDRFIDQIKILERYAIDSKRFYVLFDHSKFYPVYISENVEKEGGYSVEYILNQGLFFLFQRLHWTQLTSSYKVIKWGRKFQELVGPKVPIHTYETWYCGLKLKDKWGRWRTTILKQKMLTSTKDNAPFLSFIEAEEITNLYKANSVWYKLSCRFQGRRISRTYFSKGTKKESEDILSAREVEILKLAAQQKSNREISEILGISKHTVERHRKNMIARVGAMDITGLIKIAQIVKIL